MHQLCPGAEPVPVLEMPNVPVHCNRLWPTREAALAAPRGDINLAYLPTCCHLYNRAFDPEAVAYGPDYENSLHYSARFQAYADELAQRLIERHNLRDKQVVEIGCGRGDFLRLLCRLGRNRGLGFDPSYRPDDGPLDPAITIEPVAFGEGSHPMAADAIICRHVLEHLAEPGEFLAGVRRAVGNRPDVLIFFEVPNGLYTVQGLGIWDLIYEHCSYFTPTSLRHLFARGGFEVMAIASAFGGQFLTVEARIAKTTRALPGSQAAAAPDIDHAVGEFAGRYRQKLGGWRRRLAKERRLGRRVAIWGAGSKGVTFLNLAAGADEIACAVDVNPRKRGMFVAGVGVPIVAPDALQEMRPDLVVVMNENYREEIAHAVALMGVSAELAPA